jgi:hypothetical protein
MNSINIGSVIKFEGNFFGDNPHHKGSYWSTSRDAGLVICLK